MSLWSFTEMSEILECSPQNIYQKKAKLKRLGYIEFDTDGKEKINENGYNYLLEQRKATMKTASSNLNNTCLNNEESIENSRNTPIQQDNYIVEFLQKQIEELQKMLQEEKEQKQYWQNLYVQQNDEFKKISFPLMLGTTEQNQQQAEETKKGFWRKILG